MIDDGKGFQVHIPTILITYLDAAMLVSNVNKGIEISVNFEVIQQNVAEISIWLDITNHKDLVFMRNFRGYFNKLQSFSTFFVIQHILALAILLLPVPTIVVKTIALFSQNGKVLSIFVDPPNLQITSSRKQV